MPNPSARSVSSSKDILRLSSPSISTFKNECFDVSQPAILEGCIEHWPALQKWSDLGYLNHVAGRRLVPVELGRHYLDEKWSEQLMPLSSFLREYVQKGDAHAYLAQHALLDQIPRLRRDIAMHDYCGLGEGSVTQNAWIGYGTISPLHRDKSHNLLAQRTQSREAGPPKWRSASPRQAHRPPEVLRRRAAAAADVVAAEAEGVLRLLHRHRRFGCKLITCNAHVEGLWRQLHALLERCPAVAFLAAVADDPFTAGDWGATRHW